MKEVFGVDIFEYARDNKIEVLLVTTNNVIKSNGCATMGAGIAKQVRDRWPGIDKTLGQYLKIFGNVPMNLGDHLIGDHKIKVITFPTKNNWQDPSDLVLIFNSAVALSKMVYSSFITVAPGCGHGQLKWSDVKGVVKPFMDDRFTVCLPNGQSIR